MELTKKSQLEIGKNYFKVELPCHAVYEIVINGYDEETKIFKYSWFLRSSKPEIGNRPGGNFESNFDDYFEPTRKRNQKIFTEKEEAKLYHEKHLNSEYSSLMMKHGLPPASLNME